MELKRIAFQYLKNLPFYAADSVSTWRGTLDRLSQHGMQVENLRILEVGCGYAYPYVVLFEGVGAQVIGIDILPLTRRDISPGRYAKMLKEQGILPTGRRVARDVAFNFAFDRPLRRAASLSVNPASAKQARMD